MLVVTRRPKEQISFPSLGITIHLLRTSNRNVKVGIEAPPEIQILRHEIPGENRLEDRKEIDHQLANALSKVTLAIHLAKMQWEAGLVAVADQTLENALGALESIECERTRKSAKRRFKALIIEDDDNERELLAGLLVMSGCDCQVASDGVDALAYLESGGLPDVVLVDMAMPRCDGPETLRRIRADQRFSGLRVYSVSSTNPSELRIPVGPTGFNGWFPKPLNPRKLWDEIRRSADSNALSN